MFDRGDITEILLIESGVKHHNPNAYKEIVLILNEINTCIGIVFPSWDMTGISCYSP
jgi:hypothetical protein